VKRRTLLGALALLAGRRAAAQTPKAEGRTYTPGRFDSIEINGSATVTFVQGSVDQVFVEGGDEVQRAVLLELQNGALRLNPSGSWKFWDARRLRIEVTARELARVSISGAADFTAPAPVRAERLAVAISGAGAVRFDQVDAETLNFQVSGSGDGQAAGAVGELVLRISGRGEFRGEALKAERARVSISGVGDVKVWAVQELDISVAGIGKVDYWGAPAVRRHTSGAATINERGPAPAGR
jgi:hypothetical protein